VRRNPFVTAQMLQTGGLIADARLVNGSIEVRLGAHRASFPVASARMAADWLAECTLMHYPESDFSKLWLMLARAAGGAIPFGSR
jgi:hypothetical protein